MEDLRSNVREQITLHQGFALVFIVCGVLSIAYTFFSKYDSATRPWDTVSSLNVGDFLLLNSVEPKPEEWPLIVAKSALLPRDTLSNRYTVEIKPVRGTVLLRLDVIGHSPERTTAFGQWLTDAFARDISDSVGSRGIHLHKSNSGSLIDQAPGPAIPLRLHPATLLLSLVTPLLLLASGVLLFRASKANIPDALPNDSANGN